MCGIFGLFSKSAIKNHDLNLLAHHARQRGRDSSGLVFFKDDYIIEKADHDIKKLIKRVNTSFSPVVMGHSRLITNGLGDNQPVVRNNIIVIHNGIIVNDKQLWEETGLKKNLEIDSEVIAALAESHILNGGNVNELPAFILSQCRGVVACAIILPTLGKTVIFSNNGSLYVGIRGEDTFFSSESYPLSEIECSDVIQVKELGYVFDIPVSNQPLKINESRSRTENLIPEFRFIQKEADLLEFKSNLDIKRCTRCVLPQTMPFIHFDEQGVCNYCKNYQPRNNPKPKE
ncbi:MAG: glucosamine 6-phosphate synthetase, partial [Enterovibrio sp.]